MNSVFKYFEEKEVDVEKNLEKEQNTGDKMSKKSVEHLKSGVKCESEKSKKISMKEAESTTKNSGQNSDTCTSERKAIEIEKQSRECTEQDGMNDYAENKEDQLSRNIESRGAEKVNEKEKSSSACIVTSSDNDVTESERDCNPVEKANIIENSSKEQPANSETNSQCPVISPGQDVAKQGPDAGTEVLTKETGHPMESSV